MVQSYDAYYKKTCQLSRIKISVIEFFLKLRQIHFNLINLIERRNTNKALKQNLSFPTFVIYLFDILYHCFFIQNNNKCNRFLCKVSITLLQIKWDFPKWIRSLEYWAISKHMFTYERIEDRNRHCFLSLHTFSILKFLLVSLYIR